MNTLHFSKTPVTISSMVEEARKLCVMAHGSQVRRGSTEPYYHHPWRVAEAVAKYGVSQNAIAAAYLHDTVEDTAITLEGIGKTFPVRVVELVDLLTKRPSERGDEAIVRLIASGDREALLIKLCDLDDNSLVDPNHLWEGWEAAIKRYAKRKILIIKALQQL